MNTYIAMFLLGVSLSMDTFSLALCYGTLNLNLKKSIILSITVGIFHFFMPLLGMSIGNLVINNLIIDGKLLILIILSIIGIDMIIGAFKNDEKKLLTSFIGILIFAFSVSLDSFSTGLGLNLISDNIISTLITFTITSAGFTFLGIKLGKTLKEQFGKIATIIGGIALILLGIYFFLN